MPNYIEWLVLAGLAERNEVQGLHENIIREIEKKYDITLPTTYRDFLMQCGRGAGLFGRDIDILYPNFLGLDGEFNEVATEFGIDYKPPRNAFFFSAYQGGSFHFFVCEEDDPEIYVLNDGDKEPKLASTKFTLFVKDAISSYQDAFYAEPDKHWMA